MSAQPPSKKQKTDTPPYELLYWPGMPGRGEHIRLCFEASGTPYTDTSNARKDGIKSVLAEIDSSKVGDALNPPNLCPPILRHGDLLLSQTPNILLYLGARLGLAGGDNGDGKDADGEETARLHVNQLALTALDGLSNEPHDTHHPVAIAQYYEEQKEEAKKKAEDWRVNRLPKFLGYFERVLQGEKSGGGEWLYGGRLTYADLVLFQCLDGVLFAFPKAVGNTRTSGEYEKVWALYDRVKEAEGVKEYLAGDRRLQYGNGIYRHYEELDEA